MLFRSVEAGILDREQRGKWAWFSVRTDQLSAVSEAFAVPARTDTIVRARRRKPS